MSKESVGTIIRIKVMHNDKPRAIFSTEDLDIIKEALMFYVQVSDDLEPTLQRKIVNLTHRLNRGKK
jgi:hypothetical protein